MLAVQTKALKEWAITVKALNEGRQVLLLRKGGVHAADRQFRVEAPEFLLYSTYEHQRADLLKPEYQPELARLLAEGAKDAETVTISHYARVTDVFQVTDRGVVEALSPCYIWTITYAEERLNWRPRSPLYVLLLRVYRLAEPRVLPVLSAYAGCKSWLDLAEGIPLAGLTPVLSDGEYERRTRQIKAIVGSA
ncbi:MAG: DUF1802 family protein [Chloroflexi bacterium]|nr:DUF1802 family protein [Chloroflexota bacterium]